jgi:leucyl aminopeptidase
MRLFPPPRTAAPDASLSRLPLPRRAQGGSITAALFLKEFVKETPWAHMDIAGPVWDDKQGGATGYGVKTLVSFVESHAA